MLEFLISNIFVEFGGQCFSTNIDIPMGTNCALFLHSNETHFAQKLIKDKIITEGEVFNIAFRYIDDDLSINNPNFANWISPKQ
jgi:hypothetical protein